MDSNGINDLLGQMRATAALAAGKPAQAGADSSAPGGVDFAQVLQNSINQVNQTQQQAQSMAENFSAGDPNANLHEVMIALQKANVSFQEMVQVRNRLVAAYQDVMNMQV
ncbi:flagellar hook-basal body complex protein FliE [Oryzomicrobium sp.]|uniref:flagellar hook-basal body complex protein FliE n=1 Tax=Oryzomicrobium sp. TaxID=1911578 RepID=UPI0025E77448|nr:flagellar hook-basal body complex protein FliE [Oryzomicrobium sp.]MCE1241895.1 flagellar hook-basal body complex protein FliE [Oryzomicrobium sp.]